MQPSARALLAGHAISCVNGFMCCLLRVRTSHSQQRPPWPPTGAPPISSGGMGRPAGAEQAPLLLGAMDGGAFDALPPDPGSNPAALGLSGGFGMGGMLPHGGVPMGGLAGGRARATGGTTGGTAGGTVGRAFGRTAGPARRRPKPGCAVPCCAAPMPGAVCMCQRAVSRHLAGT